MLRRLVYVVLLCVLLAPAMPSAADGGRRNGNTRHCRRMTKQISHYEGTVLKMAKDRGNRLWYDATAQQVARLKDDRADACPEWNKQRTAYGIAKAQAEFIKNAVVETGKGALNYFTGGWM
jgi:hypothetical protein